MKIESTERGFGIVRFKDAYDHGCSLQESSCSEKRIWFGVSDAGATAQILSHHARALGVPTDQYLGWISYHIPKEVMLHDRMLLSREQVKELLPILRHFVKTGRLPDPPEEEVVQ